MTESNKLEISVYKADTLVRIGLVSSWVSLSWVENYDKHGMMQLEVFAEPALAQLLAIGNCCAMTGRDALMIIRNAKYKDRKLVVTGYTADRIFEERVSVEKIPKGTAIEEKVRALIANMQPWPRVQLGAAAGLGDTVQNDVESTTIASAITGMLKGADVGFRVRFDRVNKVLIPELYKPAARGMKYSPLYGNVGDVQLTTDDIETRNVAVVYGEEPEEGATRIVVTVGDTQATGKDRREMYVSGEGREEGETDEAYRARLEEQGRAELAKNTMRRTFSLAVKDERADVGDVVVAALPELGVKLSVRITGVKITAQRGTVSRDLIYGDPFGVRRA